MASATSSHASSDPFDLGAHTPPNLARLARASQLRNSSPIVTRPIGLSSAFRRPAATPSSPLIRLSNAAATEGARREPFAEHFSNRFLDLWRQTPSDLRLASAPTYSSVAAGRTGRPIPARRKKTSGFCATPGRSTGEDHNSYAIRTHIAAKVGIDLHQVPAAFKVNSGWAIRTTDATIRDLIVQRQSEWSQDMGATDVEISQRWVRPARRKPNDPLTCTLIVSFLEPTDKPWRLFGSSRLAQYMRDLACPASATSAGTFTPDTPATDKHPASGADGAATTRKLAWPSSAITRRHSPSDEKKSRVRGWALNCPPGERNNTKE
ncbi:ribonuclease H-like protein [Hirsutella rhossiliensis]